MKERRSQEEMKKQKCVQSLCNIIAINEDNNNIKNKIKRRENVDKNYVIKHLSEMKHKTRANGGNKFEGEKKNAENRQERLWQKI